MGRIRCSRLITVGLCCFAALSDGFVVVDKLRSGRLPQLAAATTNARRDKSSPLLFYSEDSQEADSNNTSPPLVSPRNDTETLWSYVYNLQKSRREEGGGNSSIFNKQALLKPAKSFAYFLETHTCQIACDDATSVAAAVTIVELLQRAAVQAVRAAADANDYKLILQLFAACIHLANGQPVLDRRIMGETISALGRTDANKNKIRTVWNEATSPSTAACWATAFGPREVTSMLQVLVGRKQVRAALDLYHEHQAMADAYSLSIVLNALTASIGDQQKLTTDHQLQESRTLQNVELVPLLSQSYCWQWNKAVYLLDRSRPGMLNNPVMTALLQLNKRTAQVFPEHDGPARTIFLTEFMKARNIAPDHITSTLILSNLGTAWKMAVALLRSSSRRSANGDDVWSLQSPPNAYMYSAAMAACARSRQYTVTVQLLHEMEGAEGHTTNDDDDDDQRIKPTAYVYNSVLQALTVTRERRGRGKIKASARERAKERVVAALKLFGRMRRVVAAVQPNTVTFNTLLAVVAGARPVLQSTDWSDLAMQFPDVFATTTRTVNATTASSEQLVTTLLDQMKREKVGRDAVTYKHAIQAVGDGDGSVLRLVHRGLAERNRICALDIYQSGLSVLADFGDFDGTAIILLAMLIDRTRLNSESAVHIINALGNGNMTSSLPGFLDSEAASDHDQARVVAASHGLDLREIILPRLDASHFAAAICCCLRVSDFESARQLLVHMRALGVRPSPELLQELARSYAIIALEHDTKTTKQSADGGDSASYSGKEPSVRARSAFAILSSIESPSAALVSIVARACCSAGMFREAQVLLRTLHKRVLQSRFEQKYKSSLRPTQHANLGDNEKMLPGLHRDLLKFCAEQGNVTNALRLCEDIQYFSTQLATASMYEDASLPRELSTIRLLRNGSAEVEPDDGFGMTATSWKSVIVAASKSGHWRVCLSTLQFLRPYLEASHPSKARSKEERARLTETYGRLESAMNTVVKCLAVRSQYAWIVRAIDDWVEWGGRRPPRDAALAAVRVLSNRGRGEEVNSLLARCTTMASSHTKCDDKTYNPTLLVGAITALYNDGLYDEADDAFVAAITQRALPFNLERQTYGAEKRITLDLHGMNLAVAHSAVRIALQQEAVSASWNRTELWDNDMVIVTGRGLNSAVRMRPVLRPAVQRMLVEEFYPPLGTTSVPGNMGAIRISSEDILEWLVHQRQQKGARLLMVAAMLKNIAYPGGRLRAALSKANSLRTTGIDRAVNESG